MDNREYYPPLSLTIEEKSVSRLLCCCYRDDHDTYIGIIVDYPEANEGEHDIDHRFPRFVNHLSFLCR